MTLMFRLLGILVVLALLSQHVNSQDFNTANIENAQFIKSRGYSNEACFRIATDYLKSSTEQPKAIAYLEHIIDNDPTSLPDIYLMLAEAYYYNCSFDMAVKKLNQYIEKQKDNKLKKEARLKLEKFQSSRELAAKPLNVFLVNLGPNINSKYPDINPYVSSLDNLLIYGSNRSDNYNIFVSKKNKQKTAWQKSKLAGNMINTVNDEFVGGLSRIGDELFVHYNQTNGFEDINVSKRSKGLYRELADPGINTTYREEGACKSKSGDTIYLASDRDGGFGGFDIYYCLKLPDESWGPAINMGQSINTPFDENYPNLSLDGSKLYFASKGHNSIGGYDIFYSNFDIVSNYWSAPLNVGYPINNPYDNTSLTFTENGRYAYISTVGKNSFGNYDIYKVIFLDTNPDYLIIKAQAFVNENGLKLSFNDNEEELSVTIYNNNETYGIYTFDKLKNSFILALVPGQYILEIKSDNFETYRKRITIQENFYKNNQRSIKVYLNRLQSN